VAALLMSVVAAPASAHEGKLVGKYRLVVPTAPGSYTFHLSGAINGQKVDQAFTSGPRTFSEVADPAKTSFPASQDPTTGQLAKRLDREVPRLTGALAASQAAERKARDEARQARLLGLGGVLLALVARPPRRVRHRPLAGRAWRRPPARRRGGDAAAAAAPLHGAAGAARPRRRRRPAGARLGGHRNGPSPLRWLELAAQWAHLVAVGVWIGGLAWLLRGLRGQERRQQVAASLRFSRLAATSLAVVVLTGLARTLDELGGWRQLQGSGYGRVLAVKPVLVGGLAGLGAVNRYRVLPALMAGTARVSRLRGTVRGELGLAAAVLAAAALLSAMPPDSGRTEPAASAATPRFVHTSGSDDATAPRLTLGVAGLPPPRFQASG
jgi:hypothetical protein